MVKAALLVGALASASCLRETAFHCTADAECGAGGTCQVGFGYCSVADASCASGARFGDSAGSYAGHCVGDDAPVDASAGDAASDAPPSDAPAAGCNGFHGIAGGTAGHTYRLINATASWQAQRMTCGALSNNAYLAIPDDLAELQAIAMLAASTESWVGISDQAQESTFVTVNGDPATFLPWDAMQPDDQGPGEDCVIIETPTSKLRDERCASKFRAVCECE